MANYGKYVTEALEPRVLLAAAVLVKDLNPGTLASSPSAGLTVGTKSFFSADDGINGRELWVTDGTAAGTTLVKDIRSGASGSNPFLLGAVNNFLFFTADNGVNGTELWRSDGTAAGTTLFKEFTSGSTGSSISVFQMLNGLGYFVVSKALWRTDGTAQGTVLVDSSISYGSLTLANNSLYFEGSTAEAGDEVWRSDGTAAGKVLLEVNPGPAHANPSMFTEANGAVYFRAYGVGDISGLWKTDGTPEGTVKVRDIQLDNLTSLDAVVVFKGSTDGTVRLWRSDGTPDGTYPISDVAPINGNQTVPFEKANGMIFYEAGAQEGQYGLWKSDGTAAGTGRILPVEVLGSIGGIKSVGDKVFFSLINSGTRGFWKSDGTVDGTVLVSSPFSQISAPIAQLGSRTLYSLGDQRGLELWETDGSAGGTRIVKDINVTALNSDPKALADVNGTLFFTAANGVWKSDGTDAGTVLVKALDPLFTTTHERDVGVNLGGQYIFTASNQLWRSDGTPQGTIQLKSNVNMNVEAGTTTTLASELFAANGYAVYDAIMPNGNVALWRTDGTAAGTFLLMEFPGFTMFPSNFTLFNGAVYFTPTRRVTNVNTSLWKTDGTVQGTVMVNASAGVMRPIEYKQKLWYSGCDTVSGCELWNTDGNGAGTKFADILSGVNGSKPSDFVVANGLLYFTAEISNNRVLWKTDGTLNGLKSTTIILNPVGANGTIFGTNGSRIVTYNGSFQTVIQGPLGTDANFTTGNGIFFFTNNNSIWISDGSASGTVKLMDQPINQLDPARLVLTTFNNAVYFRAVDPVLGNELFKLTPPIVRSSGPFTVGIGNNVTLDASGSFDPDASKTLSFAWDLDNDGIFGETGSAAALGDEVGANPVYKSSAQIAGNYPVSLRVSSSSGLASQLSTTVIVRTSRFIGTPGNDVFRVMLVGDHVDFYENAPAGGGPTFSIPLLKMSIVFVDPSDGDDSLSINFRASLAYNGGAGKDTVTITGGDWVVDPSSLLGVANLVLGNTATMLIHLTRRFDSMTLSDSAKAKMDVDGITLHLGSLSIQGNATLDIADKPLIVDHASISDINAMIKGHSIFSSSNLPGRVVGAIINSNGAGGPLYSTFGGENLSGGEILLRYTTNGDINLDNQVSISDFIDLAAHIGQSPATWQDGDLNDDGAVTIADFIMLASNFEQGSAGAATPQAALSMTSAPVAGKIKHHRSKPHHRVQSVRQQLPLVLLERRLAEKR